MDEGSTRADASAATTGRCVLIVGPDGTGKSTVADALHHRAEHLGVQVERVHWRRGGAVPKRHRGPVDDPHGATPRGLIASLVKVAGVTVDFLVAAVGPWRKARSRGLLLVERGWPDMAVDPVRYRIDSRLAPIARLTAYLVPKADVAILLTGDPMLLHARKPELPLAELERQNGEWRSLAPRVAKKIVVVDTTNTSIEDTVAKCGEAVAGIPAPWKKIPFTPQRISLCTQGAVGPWGVYQPLRNRARAAGVAGRLALRAGCARRTSSPVPELEDLLQHAGVRADGLVAIRSSTPGRHVISAQLTRQPVAVLKIGAADDAGLHREAEVLGRPLRPVETPELLWAGLWSNRFVVATRPCEQRRRPLHGQELLHLCNNLVAGAGGAAPLLHGDLAPWNITCGVAGPALIDWEFSRDERAPLHDLAHYLVQEGALLGRRTPADTARLLTSDDGMGRAHLAAVGEPPSEAPALVLEYLHRAPQSASQRVNDFRTLLAEAVA